MKKPIFLLFALGFSLLLHSQTPVTVADLTVKINAKSEEVLYYGFAAGDQVVLSVEMLEGKSLKEVEVLEYPGIVRFKDYEVEKLGPRTLEISKKSILEFRFVNADLIKGRVCKLTIQRIPVSPEGKAFNTAVHWKEVFDTTWVMVSKEVDHGGEVWQVEKTRRVLVSVDTSIQQVLSRTERVHSRTKIQAENQSEVCFELPKNQYEPNAKEPYHTSEVVAWAYTITVGESGKQWFNQANVKATAKAAASVATKLGVISTGYGALAVLAIEGISLFTTPPSGDNIQYETYTMIGDEKKVLDAGNSVASSKRITDYRQGRFCISMENDNIMEGINAELTVIAVMVNHTYADEVYTVTETGPRKEKVEVKEARVAVKRIPVFATD